MSDIKIKVKRTVKNKVLWLLKKYPELRDDKPGVCKAIWMREIWSKFPNCTLETFSCSQFMELLINGAISNPETILRWWRKLQELNPELRGKEYESRHAQEPSAIEHFNN
jgi:hypothetical protein